MDLRDTVDGMLSSDYKERFIAEYEQACIRYLKLVRMITAAEIGTLSFTPTCPLSIHRVQRDILKGYIDILAHRAELEKIELPSVSL